MGNKVTFQSFQMRAHSFLNKIPSKVKANIFFKKRKSPSKKAKQEINFFLAMQKASKYKRKTNQTHKKLGFGIQFSGKSILSYTCMGTHTHMHTKVCFGNHKVYCKAKEGNW